MIHIWVGNLGSGKTACAVRYMFLHQKEFFYSNIKNSLKNCFLLSADMILKKELFKTKKSGEDVFRFSVNADFWKKAKKPCSVVLDEAHTLLNPRKSMSNVNVAVTDWLALLRRVLGEDSKGSGDLFLITQLPQRVDLVARELAVNVFYHVCHFVKVCKSCGFRWAEDSDLPEQSKYCLRCNSFEVFKTGFVVEVKCFSDINSFFAWKSFGYRSFYKSFFVRNLEKYFGLYNTLQWESMFSGLY